jgi:predicted O-linked N-acetylglucosamine transferase (SPINDLY family)
MERAEAPTIWLPHLKRPEFLALLALADVSLDPPLWSGGNTTIEALTLGTPVVTLPGPFMRGRHSYAFLKIANAEGLIATDEEDFVALASDFDRQREAMREAEPGALFNDRLTVELLDDFLEQT